MATKWGVLSAGRICHDFVTAVRSSGGEDHEFVAVAARSIHSAEEFASRHGILVAYGSYEELAKDPNIDVVYVGTITSQHFPVGKLMLEHGKNVLMEKPMTLNLEQTKALIEMARKNKCFLMEAVWSRFLPAYEHLMKLLREKVIGDVVHVSANIGQPIMGKYEGAGGIRDMGIYAVNIVSMVYRGEKPTRIAAVGCLNEEGIDTIMAGSLQYSDRRTAQIATNAMADLPCDLVITGTQGHIKIPSNMWCATTLQTPDKTFDFPLPDVLLPCHFINSSGLRYQAAEVRRCLLRGILESSVMPLQDSEMLAKIMDELCRQVGVDIEKTKH